MSQASPPGAPPVVLADRALDNLRYIREAMEGSATFTAVPGWGQVGSGATAVLAALLASRQPTPGRWLAVWLAAAAVAAAISGVSLAVKARRTGAPLASGPARKFFLAFAPPVVAAALLTPALFLAGEKRLLPGTWLLLYGAGVVTAGAHSIRVVPAMGLSLMAAGAVALLLPEGLADAAMAAGFGLLLAGFGVVIARRHGG
ncbi:hypothetical protein FBQ97_18620 [Acidobacteria bacterium ACD]|nr:MAG: hypothetical protein EDX89_19115 [Acidobacteriota bacterium]MDL1951805.1 hypothetical protein [Acidobacteria bacterium ACD]